MAKDELISLKSSDFLNSNLEPVTAIALWTGARHSLCSVQRGELFGRGNDRDSCQRRSQNVSLTEGLTSIHKSRKGRDTVGKCTRSLPSHRVFGNWRDPLFQRYFFLFFLFCYCFCFALWLGTDSYVDSFIRRNTWASLNRAENCVASPSQSTVKPSNIDG